MKTLVLTSVGLALLCCVTACDGLTGRGSEGDAAIVFHIGQGCMSCAEDAINKGADVNITNKFGVTPLMEASGPMLAVGEPEALRRGYEIHAFEFVTIVEQLIAAGADVDAEDQNGVTALHRAARNNRVGTAYILLSNDAKFSITEEQLPLEVLIAARECYPSMTILLARAASREFNEGTIYGAIGDDPNVCPSVKDAIISSNRGSLSFAGTALPE